MGGITGYMVDMQIKGYFDTILDVQCFDLKAIESIRENPKHQEISAMRYASPAAKSAAVDSLDVVILGATQVDVNFNVNVHTDSNGYIMGGSGGHCDTAAGAKLAIIVAPLIRARLPLIVDEAHGAHFAYGDAFPKSALELGADAVIQSVHKTLPSLTQTALLHVKNNRPDGGCYLDIKKIERYLQIYQSSSPSYVLMASIENSIFSYGSV